MGTCPESMEQSIARVLDFIVTNEEDYSHAKNARREISRAFGITEDASDGTHPTENDVKMVYGIALFYDLETVWLEIEVLSPQLPVEHDTLVAFRNA